ncbi:hypothetical protein ACFL6U_18425, partial [Planctomycetota bacterium]
MSRCARAIVGLFLLCVLIGAAGMQLLAKGRHSTQTLLEQHVQGQTQQILARVDMAVHAEMRALAAYAQTLADHAELQ